MLVKELIKYIFGAPDIRIIDQPYEILFYGKHLDLKQMPKYEYLLSREIESFSPTSSSCLTITLEEATWEEQKIKEENAIKFRLKDNYKRKDR